MRVNSVLVAVLFSLLVIVFPASSFANNKSAVSKETILKIDDSFLSVKYVDAKKTIIFTEPGRQKLTIANYSKQDIAVGDIYFVGDEFTTPLVVNGFSLHGGSRLSIVKSGTSCSVEIAADQKASPTVNPDGQPILLNYKVIGEKEGRFIQFKVKSTYNDYVRFKERNVDFTFEASLEDKRCVNSGALTIVNNSKDNIYIKDVSLTKNGEPVGRLECNDCGSLSSGSTCQVALAVDCKLKEDTDVLPILVTYNVVSEDGIKEDLKAVAAAVINSTPRSEDEMQVVHAAFSGFVMTKSIHGVYSQPVRNIFVAVLGKSSAAEAITTTSLGLLMGVGYSADGYVDGLMDYRSGKVTKWVDAASLQYYLALTGCMNNKNALSCMVLSMGCGLFASVATGYIQQAVYSNIVHRLPEQKSFLATYWDKSKLLFNFGVMTAIRVGCKALVGVDTHGGLGEVYTESLSALMIPWASGAINFSDDFVRHTIFGKERPLPFFSRNDTLLVDDYCGENCVCSEFDDFEEDEL